MTIKILSVYRDIKTYKEQCHWKFVSAATLTHVKSSVGNLRLHLVYQFGVHNTSQRDIEKRAPYGSIAIGTGARGAKLLCYVFSASIREYYTRHLWCVP